MLDEKDARDRCQATCEAYGQDSIMESTFAVGDPHLKNIGGEGFDVLRTGVFSLLEYPLKVKNKSSGESKLKLEASVEHPGNESFCKGYFILKLWIKGSLVGEEIEVATSGKNLRKESVLTVKFGNKTMHNLTEVQSFVTNGKYKVIGTDDRSHMAARHPHHRFKFASMKLQVAGVALDIGWFTGHKQSNRLDFKAHHLKKLGAEWGGILGKEGHTWASSYDPKCKKSDDFGRLFNLKMEPGTAPWKAMASLN